MKFIDFYKKSNLIYLYIYVCIFRIMIMIIIITIIMLIMINMIDLIMILMIMNITIITIIIMIIGCLQRGAYKGVCLLLTKGCLQRVLLGKFVECIAVFVLSGGC